MGEKKGNPALDSEGICQSEIATDCWCEREEGKVSIGTLQLTIASCLIESGQMQYEA